MKMEFCTRGVYTSVTILALTGLTLSTQKSVEMSIQPAGDILEGDTLTITCRITGRTRFEPMRLERRFGGTYAVISTNQYIDDLFSDDARYNIMEYTIEDGVTTLETEIDAVEGRDGGIISCNLLGSTISAEEEINVHVKPKSVELFYQNALGDWIRPVDGLVTIKRGVTSGVMCKVVVDGTTERPDIQLTMGNKNVMHLFEEEETLDESLKLGYKHVVRTTDLKYITDSAAIDHHNKLLSCSAKLPEFNRPVIDQAQLEVRYAPELDCDSRRAAKIGSTNVQIVCKGRMHPAPLDMSWSYGKRPNRTVLYHGDTRDNITVEKIDKGDMNYEFVLSFNEVNANHFRRYKLEVNNGIGEKSAASVRFYEEGKGYQWIDNSSPAQHHAQPALLTAIICSLFVSFKLL